jgi:hypothetical protein
MPLPANGQTTRKSTLLFFVFRIQMMNPIFSTHGTLSLVFVFVCAIHAEVASFVSRNALNIGKVYVSPIIDTSYLILITTYLFLVWKRFN